MVIPPALATILIASFPVAVESNLNPPVPADTSIKIALAPNFVDASLPMVIVLAEAPEPILIFCATASSPILIAPADEFKDNAPIVSHSNPFVPSCFIIVWLSPNLNCALLRSNCKSELNDTSELTLKRLLREISLSTVTFVVEVPNTN